MIGESFRRPWWHITSQLSIWCETKRKVLAYLGVFHESLDDFGVKAGIGVAPKHSGSDVESASDLSLCMAMYELGKVMCEAAVRVVIFRQSRLGNHGELDEKGRRKSCDESGRGSKTGFVNILDLDPGGREGRDLLQGLESTGKAKRF
jgi:hypothetical protein